MELVAVALAAGFAAGWVVGWIQASEPLKAKVTVLQVRVRELEKDLKWSRVSESAAKLDLERAREKQSELSMALDLARSKAMGQDHK